MHSNALLLRRPAKAFAAFAAALGLILGSGVALQAQSKNEYDLKDIGHRGVGKGLDFYSLSKEMALGKTLAQQVVSTAHIVKDPQINEYVNRVAQNLVRHSDAHVPFTVYVVDSPEINAMALPGGYFFVNTGLIMAADDESELAGVMAHEIAHVAARHATRNMTKAELLNYASLPLIFVGGGIGYGIQSAASLALPLSFLKFSRGAEKEADFLGTEYMYEAGYDPQGMVDMFEKLKALQKHSPGLVAKAFSTHPATPDRIRATEREIAKVLPPKPEYVVTTSDFNRMKARLAMLEHRYREEDQLTRANRPSLRHPAAANKPHSKNGKPTLERRPE